MLWGMRSMSTHVISQDAEQRAWTTKWLTCNVKIMAVTLIWLVLWHRHEAEPSFTLWMNHMMVNQIYLQLSALNFFKVLFLVQAALNRRLNKYHLKNYFLIIHKIPITFICHLQIPGARFNLDIHRWNEMSLRHSIFHLGCPAEPKAFDCSETQDFSFTARGSQVVADWLTMPDPGRRTQISGRFFFSSRKRVSRRTGKRSTRRRVGPYVATENWRTVDRLGGRR